MRPIVLLASVVFAAAASAQPSLTAEQVIEKSIAATGGREAIKKISSSYAKGLMEFPASEAHGIVERYSKAPDKQLTVTFLEGVGESRQGFDGHVAWNQDPSGQVTELSGAALEEFRRGASFNAVLNWRTQYPKAELAGKQPVGDREAYVIKLTAASGRVTTRYYDARTFLLLRETSIYDTPQGDMVIVATFSDYRDIDGIQTPFRIHQLMPVGEIVFTTTELKNNVPIDDAQFSKPGK
jgi:zinc protease